MQEARWLWRGRRGATRSEQLREEPFAAQVQGGATRGPDSSFVSFGHRFFRHEAIPQCSHSRVPYKERMASRAPHLRLRSRPMPLENNWVRSVKTGPRHARWRARATPDGSGPGPNAQRIGPVEVPRAKSLLRGVRPTTTNKTSAADGAPARFL
jgi:hypothetical protein